MPGNELTLVEAERRLQALPKEGPLPGPRAISEIMKLVKLDMTQELTSSFEPSRVNMEFMILPQSPEELTRVTKFLHQLWQAAQGEFRWDGF